MSSMNIEDRREAIRLECEDRIRRDREMFLGLQGITLKQYLDNDRGMEPAMRAVKNICETEEEERQRHLASRDKKLAALEEETNPAIIGKRQRRAFLEDSNSGHDEGRHRTFGQQRAIIAAGITRGDDPEVFDAPKPQKRRRRDPTSASPDAEDFHSDFASVVNLSDDSDHDDAPSAESSGSGATLFTAAAREAIMGKLDALEEVSWALNQKAGELASLVDAYRRDDSEEYDDDDQLPSAVVETRDMQYELAVAIGALGKEIRDL